ncbi:triphosphoribosyl-dephospho-CoA synthase [Singulisphaera sp. GP187]|uniref:triphosphoribosyl-dephospho-CoA synthase n=1 Tax=Singulisphaera sp. GP187 TaxID=1882752 RepID=UPI00092AD55F|nr:triphosphoribosyl-dephospho-CoA synthase [Singulisphaera sp. GP187]SIO65988.1 triphosphoribosyl-dephospho-CoA synthase [Singulisphaera sp. GP187]
MTSTNVSPLSPGQLAQIACLLEVSARKPGNVYPGRGFADANFVDFLLSASVIAAPFDRARQIGVGGAVLEAVEATCRVVATNTNLGMILLFAPLAAVPEERGLRDGLPDVLNSTTVADTRLVYQAIRRARPGGLGSAPDQDVADEPSVTLVEAMRLAADRDLVAAQYANAFADMFDLALPALRASLTAGRPLETAIVAAYLTVLSHRPDSLIARKRGRHEALDAARRATVVLKAGWPDSKGGQSLCEAFDGWLREEGHSRNPGATADLIAAALFAALRDGTIPLPRPVGAAAWSDE